MAAVEQHIEYERELHAGDIVSVSSAIADVMDKALRTVHEMRNDLPDLKLEFNKYCGIWSGRRGSNSQLSEFGVPLVTYKSH